VIVQRKENDSDKLLSRLYVIGGTDKTKVLKSVEYMDLKIDLKKGFENLDGWKYAQEMRECRFLACTETLKGDINSSVPGFLTKQSLFKLQIKNNFYAIIMKL